MRTHKYQHEIELLLNLYHVLRESGDPTYDASRRLTLEQRTQIVYDVRKALHDSNLVETTEFGELTLRQLRKLSITFISRQMLPLRDYLAGRPGGVA